MKKLLPLSLSALFLIQGLMAQRPLYDAPLGIQAYTFRKSFPIDVAKTLDTIRMMGFTEMEGGGGRMAPQDFKKLCDERGISIPSTGAGYDDLLKHPDSIIYRAKIFGAKYVMCAWIPHDKSGLTIENTKKGGGDPVALMKKYGNRWKLMHLKDLRKGVAKDLTGLTSPENDVPLGTGELD